LLNYREQALAKLPCLRAQTNSALANMSNALVQTAARWKIPRALATAVIARDRHCVYCGRVFEIGPGPRTAWASWEHIVNDIALVNEANIALCCIGCNSSKGTHSLERWLESKNCKKRGVTMRTLAPIALTGLHTPGASAE
jgi:5-methylcytosine-specific restriction endonuclease McrA